MSGSQRRGGSLGMPTGGLQGDRALRAAICRTISSQYQLRESSFVRSAFWVLAWKTRFRMLRRYGFTASSWPGGCDRAGCLTNFAWSAGRRAAIWRWAVRSSMPVEVVPVTKHHQQPSGTTTPRSRSRTEVSGGSGSGPCSRPSAAMKDDGRPHVTKKHGKSHYGS